VTAVGLTTIVFYTVYLSMWHM